MNTRLGAVATVAAVALVVIAGCSGLTVTDATPRAPTQTTAEPTPAEPTTAGVAVTETVTVTEHNATLGDVNASLVYARVGELVSVDGPSPPPVHVFGPAGNTGTVPTNQLFRLFGVQRQPVEGTNSWVGGRMDAGRGTYDVLLVRLSNATDAAMEAILAHEFAHAYQMNAVHSLPENTTAFTRDAVHEGAVEYVTWRYVDRYDVSFDEAATLAEAYRQAGPVRRAHYAPYLYGARYARNFSDPDAPLESMYENPPTTDEQVLHGLPPGSESPKQLTARGVTGEDWVVNPTATRRIGEARLKFVLESGVSRDRAATAAAGWGNDRWLEFVSSHGYGYAWVLHWDTASDAREFERAFTDYQQNVSVPLDVKTVGEEATVVFAGNASFVENATASGTAENVTVSV
ncbi:hypothetical protein [Halobacterium zhouii]|uniref:hypothetical protein n=1 Tax=Halobacterium zhouii TaxID=2902624 RepID=UPI001E2B6B81|nr:hypothetical protein [Halobacterium zhouii]